MNLFQRIVLRTAAQSVPELREVVESAATIPHLRESLSQLMRDMTDDPGWQRLIASSEQEFTPEGIKIIIRIARVFFLKNPLIRRGVFLATDYVFGRGFEMLSENSAANAALLEFMNNPANASEMSLSGLAAAHHTLQHDGNLFYCFFSDPNKGGVRIRTIDALEIADILTNPDDSSEPWFYKRTWSQSELNVQTGTQSPRMMTAWYPALSHQPADRIPKIGQHEVMWDNPVLHRKVGGLKRWRFGLPTIYSALDWATAYKGFLEDWRVKAHNLARFSLNVTTKGGDKSVTELREALNTTVGTTGRRERNPAPVTGSAMIHGHGVTAEAFKVAGANQDPEEGRRVLLMVCAALELAETMFGDVSVGTLATATSLDRPTELRFKREQEGWRETLVTIGNYVLTQRRRAPNSPFREALHEAQQNGKPATVIVRFPSVIEPDVAKSIEAIVKAATLDGKQMAGMITPKTLSRTLNTELEVEDPQGEADALYPEGYDPTAYAATPPGEAQPEPAADPAGA